MQVLNSLAIGHQRPYILAVYQAHQIALGMQAKNSDGQAVVPTHDYKPLCP